MKKKIYICVTPFFPSKNNWRGAYVLDQVKAIKRLSDYEVIVFKTFPITSPKERDYEIEGISVHCITPLLMPSYLLNGMTGKLVGKLFAKTLVDYNINIKDIEYVHCHTTNHSAFGFGVKAINSKTKVIIQIHDLDPLTLRNGIWANKRWNRRYRARKSLEALNKADLLICVSEPVRNALFSFPKPRQGEVYENALTMLKDVQDLPSPTPIRTYVLNNGVDTSVFNTKCKIAKDNSIYKIGCIANFNDWKDHITLLQAFNILIKDGYDNIKLSLLGSGETKDSIRQYATDNGLLDLIEWPEEVPHEQLADYYHSLDLFVLPSRYEGFGCVYTEAFACGVPFICCENQGAAECIREIDTDKWLAKDRDPYYLAELIKRQYHEQNIQILKKNIDIDILIKEYIEFISKELC